MKAFSRLLAASALLGVAGCSTLPEAGLGGTFGIGNFLTSQIAGDSFNMALAREYQAMADWTAKKDVNWYNATAYMRRAQAALGGAAVSPWDPAALGLGGDTLALYQTVRAAISANSARNPQACARAQALYDKYLEEVSQGNYACSDPADLRAKLEEALKACGGAAVVAPAPVAVVEPAPAPAPVVYAPAAPAPLPVVVAPAQPVCEPCNAPVVAAPAPVVQAPMVVAAPEPVYAPAPAPTVVAEPPAPTTVVAQPEAPKAALPPSLYTIYFGFDRSDLTAEANQVISDIVTAFKAFGNPFLNIVGHTDSSGSKAYNQRLAERRANTVANALEAQGLPRANMRVSASGELAPAIPSGDSVKKAENRRVTVEITQQ